MKWLVSLIMALWAVMSMAAPPQGEFLPGLDEDSMRVRLLQYDLQPIEGIWQYKAEHMTLGIERCSGVQDAEYRIEVYPRNCFGVCGSPLVSAPRRGRSGGMHARGYPKEKV